MFRAGPGIPAASPPVVETPRTEYHMASRTASAIHHATHP